MTATAADFYRQWTALMRSWGFTVVEVDGWQTRGATASFYDPRGGFTEHHDASGHLSGNWGSLPSIVAGRAGANPVPGPLSNLQFARDGQIALVAAGPGNHAGTGGPRLGLPANDANRRTTGAEVANDGVGEPYSPALTRALVHGEAAWAIVAGRTANYVFGHKEWTDRKIDPRVSMNDRRAAVAAVIANNGPQEDDDMTPDQDAMLRFLYNRIAGRDVQRWMKQNPDGSPIITGPDDPEGWPARSVDIADILTLTGVVSGGDAAVLAHVDAGSAADADRDTRLAAQLSALGTEPAAIVEALRAGLGDDFAKQVVAELGKQLAD